MFEIDPLALKIISGFLTLTTTLFVYIWNEEKKSRKEVASALKEADKIIQDGIANLVEASQSLRASVSSVEKDIHYVSKTLQSTVEEVRELAHSVSEVSTTAAVLMEWKKSMETKH